jgi:hypothetical protein
MLSIIVSLRGAKRRGNRIKEEANLYFYEFATLPIVARNDKELSNFGTMPIRR